MLIFLSYFRFFFVMNCVVMGELESRVVFESAACKTVASVGTSISATKGICRHHGHIHLYTFTLHHITIILLYCQYLAPTSYLFNVHIHALSFIKLYQYNIHSITHDPIFQTYTVFVSLYLLITIILRSAYFDLEWLYCLTEISLDLDEDKLPPTVITVQSFFLLKMSQQWKAVREGEHAISPKTTTPHNQPVEVKKNSKRQQKEQIRPTRMHWLGSKNPPVPHHETHGSLGSGAKLWNSIPMNIRNSNTIVTFKSHMYQHLLDHQ